MKEYIKNYMKKYNYVNGTGFYLGCEVCFIKADDIHHIEPKGIGGSKLKDDTNNLIALCRSCHDKAHNGKIKKESLKKIVKLRSW